MLGRYYIPVCNKKGILSYNKLATAAETLIFSDELLHNIAPYKGMR